MRVLTLGAGTVGTWIADLLCRHRHDVTVVDTDSETVKRINADLDVRAIHGSASQSSVLFQAGVLDADICLAVTGIDEVNLVAASMAKAMGADRTIARVYAPIFRDSSTFDYQRHFNIDRLLSLEHLTSMELARAIHSPETITLQHFARGQLEVDEIEVTRRSDGLGKPLKDLRLPSTVRIAAIRRGDRAWIAQATDHVELGDQICLIGKPDVVEEIKPLFTVGQPPSRFVVIAGGGETGFHLARALEAQRHRVLLLEADPDRCDYLANYLSRATVVCADATRKLTLEEERVGHCDYFVACTGLDENNIMACLEAKELGAKKIMAVVGRPDYASIVSRLGIDLAVSERDVMARQVLSMLEKGAVVSRKRLPGSDIFVLEIDVQPGSTATEAKLKEWGLPPGVLVAAVLEGDFVKVPGADDTLSPGTTALVLASSEQVDEVVQVFESPQDD
ncbi:MAG: Trk system potassium transport protein TrkA [Pirellulaceae bacterium]|nr:MAG: Trk system potassium transport protein TrkA [Pirellulaceae bacterium]